MNEVYFTQSVAQAVDGAQSIAQERYGHRGLIRKVIPGEIQSDQREVEVRLELERIHRFCVRLRKKESQWLVDEIKEGEEMSGGKRTPKEEQISVELHPSSFFSYTLSNKSRCAELVRECFWWFFENHRNLIPIQSIFVDRTRLDLDVSKYADAKETPLVLVEIRQDYPYGVITWIDKGGILRRIIFGQIGNSEGFRILIYAGWAEKHHVGTYLSVNGDFIPGRGENPVSLLEKAYKIVQTIPEETFTFQGEQ